MSLIILVRQTILEIEQGIIEANCKLDKKTFLMPEEIEIETYIGNEKFPSKLTFKTALYKDIAQNINKKDDHERTIRDRSCCCGINTFISIR